MKKQKPKSDAGANVSGRALGQVAIVLGAVLAIVAGLLATGRWMRQRLAPMDQFALHFDSIECLDPPGLGHAEFLAEVRYLAELPESIAVLSDDVAARIGQAFTRHPWVEKVIRVDLTPSNPRVKLVFRTPLLAVTCGPASSPAGNHHGAPMRVVDSRGVLLPANAPSTGLPIFHCGAWGPACPAGHACADPGIEAAVMTVAYLRDLISRLEVSTLRARPEGLRLVTSAGSEIIWGRPPGHELSTEAKAADKRDWLLQHLQECTAAGRGRVLVDLRGPGQTIIHPLGEPTAAQRDR